jgi:hypothetical protein
MLLFYFYKTSYIELFKKGMNIFEEGYKTEGNNLTQ